MRYPQRRTPFFPALLLMALLFFNALFLASCSSRTPDTQEPATQQPAQGSVSSAGNAQETDPELPSGESGESLESGDSQPVSQPAPDGPIQLVFTDSQGYKLPYCLYLPADMEEGVSYPLVLFLHGAGERGSGNLAQTNDTGIIPSLTEAAFYAEHPCIILAPQCPEGEQWVDTPWAEGSYSVADTPVSAALSAVTELLAKTCEEYPADPARLYAAGVSMGGYGAWDMLLRNPDVFAAAVILCGAGDPSAAESVKHIPVWLFHGSLDEEVPPSGSREMAAALIAAGASDVRYREYPEYGHWIWLGAYEEPGLLPWLFSQSKEKAQAREE